VTGPVPGDGRLVPVDVMDDVRDKPKRQRQLDMFPELRLIWRIKRLLQDSSVPTQLRVLGYIADEVRETEGQHRDRHADRFA